MFDLSWLLKYVFIPGAVGAVCGAAGFSFLVSLVVVGLYLVVLHVLGLA